MTDLIDRQIGRLIAALEETGQRGRTLIVFMSDHGEMLGDHGLYLKGAYLYEPAIHVPLIVVLPGIILPRRHTQLVELVDLAPTILELCGLPSSPTMAGRSLRPSLTGATPSVPERDSVFCEYYDACFPYATVPRLYMIRTERYKLVVAADRNPQATEFYDLDRDPGERVNLAECVKYESRMREMEHRLRDRITWTDQASPGRAAPW